MGIARKNCAAEFIGDQFLCITGSYRDKVSKWLNFVWISGGEKRGGKATKICETYDVQQRRWVKGYAGAMPAARTEHASASCGPQLFLSGGKDNKGSKHKNLW
jgi:hypothetical protein